jgi:hypothetical protein
VVAPCRWFVSLGMSGLLAISPGASGCSHPANKSASESSSAVAAGGESLRPSDPKLVARYNALAADILETRHKEVEVVRGILEQTYRDAEGALAKARETLKTPDSPAARPAFEELAMLVGYIATEGDPSVAAVRKRLIEGGHHFNPLASMGHEAGMEHHGNPGAQQAAGQGHAPGHAAGETPPASGTPGHAATPGAPPPAGHTAAPGAVPPAGHADASGTPPAGHADASGTPPAGHADASGTPPAGHAATPGTPPPAGHAAAPGTPPPAGHAAAPEGGHHAQGEQPTEGGAHAHHAGPEAHHRTEAGHHQGNVPLLGYDPGYVVIPRAEKKVLLDASRAIARVATAPSSAALEAQWRVVESTCLSLGIAKK